MTSISEPGEGLIDGGGEMGAQLRAADWARSPLGSLESWPPALRTAVGLALASETPCFVSWGESEATFYNDALHRLLGDDVTARLGAPSREALEPWWPQLGPLLRQARRNGEAAEAVVPLPIAGDGGESERQLALSMLPLRDDGGEAGVFVHCVDVTAGALAERRLARARAMADGLGVAATAADVFRTAAEVLVTDPADVPFVLFYLVDAARSEATLASAAGLADGSAAAPAVVGFDDDAAWPVGEACRSGAMVLVDDLERRFGPLSGARSEPSRCAVLFPLRAGGAGAVTAVMVAAVGARRTLENGLLGFLELAVRQVAQALGQAHARELRERLEKEGEALRAALGAREAAEAESRAKDEFIAVVSHELRAPLGSILIWSQLLRADTPDEATLARALGMIERSTRTLAQLIDDLLDASRIIAGKLKVEKTPVELKPVVDGAVEAERMAAEGKGITLDLSVEAPRVRVAGEARRLQQVVNNLLSNAIKFTPEGGRVEVRVHRRGTHAQIEVNDTGIGIRPELLPHIFERFRQGESSRPQKGLGLGLSIARHLVELHGGSIAAVSSGEGQGSTFVVTLPLLPGDEAATAALEDAEPVATARRALEGVSVLLVDDEQDAREAVAVLLRQVGATVRSVGSAAEAMAAVEEDSFHVVLSDIAMPGEDGYVLIRKLRAHDRTARIPAMALTAYATVEDRGKALRAGYDQHMAKPVDPTQLISTVASLSRSTQRL